MKLYAIALAGLTSAAPLLSRSNSTDNCGHCNTSTEPCAIISSVVKKFYSVDENAQQPCPIDPKVANACLLSSAIDNERAYQYVKELGKYLEFQSTLAYLKYPPPGYPYAPVDVLGSIEKIANKVAAGGFSSQYVLDQTLQDLFQSTHEGHLSGAFCTAQTGIQFIRPVQLVSASFDGVELPELYVANDIASRTAAISNIVAINGQNPTDFLQEEALSQGFDPDGSYNNLLLSLGRIPNANFPYGAFGTPGSYPGPFTNVTFFNGTTNYYETKAIVGPGTWVTDIVDGASLTDIYCITPAKPKPSATSSITPTSTPSATPAPTKFPSSFPYNPVVLDPNNQIAGYYMNGTGYEDTAVLWVGTFKQSLPDLADPDTITASFQRAVTDFFAEMRQSGKKKIIVDVSGNPGGNALMPEDLFHHFFPSIEPYDGARARVGDAANIWGQTLAAIPDSLILPTQAELAAGPDSQPVYKRILQTCAYNWRSTLTETLKPFTGWYSSFFPPNLNHLDSFTANFRIPLKNSFFTELYDDLDIYGYPKNPALFLRPFQPEDIIIVTDGFCSSACAIFVELMTRQGNVKTIALGGRPNREPMQAIGGTKGSSALGFATLAAVSQILITDFLEYIPPQFLSLANDTFPGLIDLPLGDPSSLSNFHLNLEDTIPQHDEEGIPLQFVFEPADCRAFYTADMLLEPNKVWEFVWQLTWGNAQECAWAAKDWRI